MWLKRTKYILTTLGLLSFLIFSLFIAIAFVYEKEIKKQAVLELNSHLNSKVEVEEIELTALDQFPKISLKFKNIFIKDVVSNNQNDTLIFSEKLYLNFDFIDVLRGDYEVKKVVFDNSTINIKVDESGNENYLIWISDSSNNNAVNFSLEEVVFNDLSFKYFNQINNQDYHFNSSSITLNGDFFKANFSLAVNGDVDVVKFTSNHVTYLKSKKATLDINLQVDLLTKNYQFTNSLLFIEGMPFKINGHYVVNETATINLNIIGNEIQIGQIFRVFPINTLKVISTYKAKGVFEFEASIVGELSNSKSPFVSANFAINDGSVTEIESATELASIFLLGNYSSRIKKEKERLVISNFSAVIGSEKCKGNIEISNFNQPMINGEFSANLPLSEILKFTTLNWGEIEGRLNSNLKFNFNYNKNLENYNLKKLEGIFVLNNFSLINSNKNVYLKNVKGEFYTSGEQLLGSKIKGELNDSKLVSELSIVNFKKLLTLENSIPKIHAQVHLDQLLVDPFLSNENNNETNLFSIQDSVDLKISLNVKRVIYNSFKAKNLKGQLDINNGNLYFNNISLNGNKGGYQLELAISKQDESNYIFFVQGNAQNIAISNFFLEFDNFGQQYLTGDHLKGTSNVDFKLTLPFKNDLSYAENDIKALANLSIKNGELINHESVLAMGEFLNESKLAKTFIDVEKLSKSLKHISFSDLKNSIEIINGKIKVPKMEISSNVLDFNLSGVHFFNDSIDYNIAFRLKDLLSRKNKIIEGVEVKDNSAGKMVFVRMYGTTEDPVFELDRKSKKEQFHEKKKEEKQEIKAVLKDEFGVFSKDSTIEKKKANDTTVFELEWEEEKEENDESKLELKKEKPKKEKKLNKWLKKLGVEEEKEKEVIFEIDQ